MSHLKKETTGKDIQVLVATHRYLNFVIPSYCIPVETGSAFHTKDRERELPGDYCRDDTGENISIKNHEYCELTVLYWGWKNSDAQIKGLCHYRRFFHKSQRVYIFPNFYMKAKKLISSAPSEDQIKNMLQKCDIILPIPYNPFPKTVRENLEAYVYQKDIKCLETVLREDYPKYFSVYENIMERQRLPYCNMMIAKANVYDDYCEWLFPLLQKVEKRTDLSGYDRMHRRIYGYLSEVLLSVWVETRQLCVRYLNLAQIWDLWDPDKKKDNLPLIGFIVHFLDYEPLVSEIYHYYSKKKYPSIYSNYETLKNCIARSSNENV